MKEFEPTRLRPFRGELNQPVAILNTEPEEMRDRTVYGLPKHDISPMLSIHLYSEDEAVAILHLLRQLLTASFAFRGHPFRHLHRHLCLSHHLPPYD